MSLSFIYVYLSIESYLSINFYFLFFVFRCLDPAGSPSRSSSAAWLRSPLQWRDRKAPRQRPHSSPSVPWRSHKKFIKNKKYKNVKNHKSNEFRMKMVTCHMMSHIVTWIKGEGWKQSDEPGSINHWHLDKTLTMLDQLEMAQCYVQRSQEHVTVWAGWAAFSLHLLHRSRNHMESVDLPALQIPWQVSSWSN